VVFLLVMPGGQVW